MTFFKSALSHFSQQPMAVVATNRSLGSWCHQLFPQPTRFVRRVEMCMALATGQDAWGTSVSKTHRHTLLRVTLVPTGGPLSEDTLLIERVLSTGGAYHSVTPVAETFSKGGTLFHPDVHDRICVISDGPSTALAHHLEIERTLVFGEDSLQPHLTLVQFAQILDFVSRTTMLICAGGNCEFQSRSFGFTCLAALAPQTLVQRSEGGVCSDVEEMVDDSVYELGAEAFLMQIPWLVNDPASTQAVSTLLDRAIPGLETFTA